MDITAFDIFLSVKNSLFLGDYSESLTENESTDINEEDSIAVIRKKFYQFLAYLEEDKQNELNNLLMELKESQDSSKIYYNIFRVYLVFYLKGNVKEDLLTKIYNDLINLEQVSGFLQPAIYLISLILLDLDDRERFLHLTKIMENDSEIALLRFFYFLKINKVAEARKVSDMLKNKDNESVGAYYFSNVVIEIVLNNNIDKALELLSQLKQNFKMTPKLFNFIAVVLMSKGQFLEAVKPLTIGIDICLKSGNTNYDVNSLLVNLVCCYRNLGKINELKETEEKLRNYNPENKYFEKVKEFEELFEKSL